MTDYVAVVLIIAWGIVIFPFVLKMINGLTDNDNFDTLDDCRRDGLFCGFKIVVLGFFIPASVIILFVWITHK